MTERESDAFGWFILTLVALVGGIGMGIMYSRRYAFWYAW